MHLVERGISSWASIQGHWPTKIIVASRGVAYLGMVPPKIVASWGGVTYLGGWFFTKVPRMPKKMVIWKK